MIDTAVLASAEAVWCQTCRGWVKARAFRLSPPADEGCGHDDVVIFSSSRPAPRFLTAQLPTGEAEKPRHLVIDTERPGTTSGEVVAVCGTSYDARVVAMALEANPPTPGDEPF
ncbi:MAG: hypothetical protein LC798_16925 [Chloroflexi bacterium]|nr:hypothetical protein [Chloroflexota bacterium]